MAAARPEKRKRVAEARSLTLTEQVFIADSRLQACDECRRKKIKCLWRPPQCADCLRLGTECLFSGVPRQDLPPKEPLPQSEEPLSGSGNAQDASVPLVEAQSEEGDAKALMRSDVFATFLDRFCKAINHFMPIFLPERLRSKLLNNEGRMVSNDPLDMACGYAIIACVSAPESGPGSGNTDYRQLNGLLQEALELTLSNFQILSGSSLSALQTLLVLVVGMQRAASHKEAVANLLAIATRMAFNLQLHRLSESTNLTVLERMEKLQVFWSLFVLDMEMALSNYTPTCVAFDEIDPLSVEPPRFPQPGYGVAVTADGVTLSLFSARQRVLRIASRMWNHLYTTRARVQPRSTRAAAVSTLNQQLREWKAEWFNLGPANALSPCQPPEAIGHIVNLQFTYFEVLVKANPDLITKALDVSNALQDGRPLSEPSTECLGAARDTLRLAAVHGEGTHESVRASVRYTVPAMVLLLAHDVRNSANEHYACSLSLVQDGLKVLQFLVASQEDFELVMIFNACRNIWNVVTSD